MSLAIDADRVTRVLLADGWYDVDGLSFALDSYEYVWHHGAPDQDPMVLHGGGQAGVCATGFRFVVAGSFVDDKGQPLGRRIIAGPLTAILAVECRDDPS